MKRTSFFGRKLMQNAFKLHAKMTIFCAPVQRMNLNRFSLRERKRKGEKNEENCYVTFCLHKKMYAKVQNQLFFPVRSVKEG